MSAFARGAAGWMAAATHSDNPRIEKRKSYLRAMQIDMNMIARGFQPAQAVQTPAPAEVSA